MRHLLGLVVGLVVGPLLLAGFGWGTQTLVREQVLFTPSAASTGPGSLVVVLCGIAIGVLVSTRVPPVACLVVAAIFVLLALVWLAAPATLVTLVPGRSATEEGVLGLLRSGTALALGSALAVAAAVPSRWRRRPRPAGAPPGPVPTRATSAGAGAP